MGSSVSFIGNFLTPYAFVLRYNRGGIILILGFHLLGIINIQTLNFEKRIHMTQKPMRLMGVFVIGMAFLSFDRPSECVSMN